MFETDKYRSKGHLGIRGTKTGRERRHSLIFSKARWQSSFQIIGWFFLRRRKIGSHMSISLAMKLLIYYNLSALKAFDFSLSPWGRHVKYGYDLFRINLYTLLTNNVSQQFPKSYSKGALLGVQPQPETSDPLKEPL